MSEKEQFPTIRFEELKERMEVALTPIDFDTLIEKGVIRERNGWYKILKFEENVPK